MHLDTEQMKLFISEKKLSKVCALSKKVLLLVQHNLQMVSLKLLRHFCGVCVSLTLGLPLAIFYTRSIFFDMILAEKNLSEREERVPSTQWGCVARGVPPPPASLKYFARNDAARSSGVSGAPSPKWGRNDRQ